jgi:hypothetical protein
MAATTQIHGQPQLGSRAHQPKKKSRHQRGPMIAPILKAGLFGCASHIILILIGLIPVPGIFYVITLALVVIPGFFVVCISTGLLAATFSGDRVYYMQKGAEVAWMAGFWAGIGAAVITMFMAANGLLMVNIGQGVLTQFPAGQIESLSEYISPNTIALVGRVIGALLVYGIIGSLISALVSSLGGRVCVKLTQTLDNLASTSSFSEPNRA